jgi:hypothetical protein
LQAFGALHVHVQRHQARDLLGIQA